MRVGAVVAWAVAAVVAGAVAWWGVTLVGGQARQDRAGVLSPAQVTQALAQERAAAAATATSGATASSTPTPTPTTPTPTASPSGTGPTGSDDPGEVVRTVRVAGGQVGAACRDASIGLLFATPEDGWLVEVKSSGPEHVEVEFRREGEESESRLVCVAGVPELAAGED